MVNLSIYKRRNVRYEKVVDAIMTYGVVQRGERFRTLPVIAVTVVIGI